MKTKLLILLGACIPLLLYVSCKEDTITTIEPPTAKIPDSPVVDASFPEYCFVNRFIADCQQAYYLWNDKIDTDLDVRTYVSSEYVKTMIYEKDKWTTLTDDVKSLENSFAGIETTYGYSIQLWRLTNPEELFCIVEFVYPDSPAEKAGLKRGDIIYQINGRGISEANYYDLYYSSSITLGMAVFHEEEGIMEITREVNLAAVTMYQDPIIATNIISKGNHLIGYLHYSDYTLRSHSRLQEVIAEFKAAGITDMVLDLRYNPGGYSITSQFLCSMLVPTSVVNSKSIYLTELWNPDWMEYYNKIGQDMNTYFTYSYQYTNDEGRKVTEKIRQNLELTDIYILTSRYTASASEATIVGLSPYLNVTLIGENTSGKYCGGILATADYIYKDYPDFLENWGLYTMIYRFDNADPGFTFGGSLIPDIPLEEYILENPAPLGDEKEDLLAAAITLITGEQPEQRAVRAISARYSKVPQLANRVQQRFGGMVERPETLPADYR